MDRDIYSKLIAKVKDLGEKINSIGGSVETAESDIDAIELSITSIESDITSLENSIVSKSVTLALESAYSSGWVDDFLELPTVTTRAIFTVYNSSQAEWLTGMKRETDQQINIVGITTALQEQTVYVSGIFK